MAAAKMVEREVKFSTRQITDPSGAVYETRVMIDAMFVAALMRRAAVVVESKRNPGIVEIRIGQGEVEPGSGRSLVDALAQIALR